uniref:Uncharacterized protein n=1 Tax=Arundo donax TaxID=35708 RepID=A0A0A9H2J2_ARUDO
MVVVQPPGFPRKCQKPIPFHGLVSCAVRLLPKEGAGWCSWCAWMPPFFASGSGVMDHKHTKENKGERYIIDVCAVRNYAHVPVPRFIQPPMPSIAFCNCCNRTGEKETGENSRNWTQSLNRVQENKEEKRDRFRGEVD